MAEGVVDVLEAVEVEDHDGAAGGPAVADVVEQRGEPALQEGAVGQPGERVVQRLVAQLRRSARRSAGRRWRGWPRSPAGGRRRPRRCGRRPCRSVTTRAPRTPAPPRSGTATASRAAVGVEPGAASSRVRVGHGRAAGGCPRHDLARAATGPPGPAASSERVSRPLAPSRTRATAPPAGADEDDLGALGVQQLLGLGQDAAQDLVDLGRAGDGLAEAVEPLQAQVPVGQRGVGPVAQQQAARPSPAAARRRPGWRARLVTATRPRVMTTGAAGSPAHDVAQQRPQRRRPPS